MTRRWRSDPYFEEYVQQFYEAVAIPDRTTRDAQIRRLMASFKQHRVEPAIRKKEAKAAKKKVVADASPRLAHPSG